MKTKTTKLLRSITAALAVAATTLPVAAAHKDDERIVSAAKQSYVYRTYLKDDDIKIQAQDGMVTLKGEVSDRSHKGMAEDAVENLPGVKAVDNRLEVKAKPADEKSDQWMAFKLKSMLLYHRNVSGAKTEVTVKDGVATLKGTASSEAQKELTGEYAKDIDGVKTVINELSVSTEPPSRTVSEVIDDGSITAQVKSALLTHRSTSALKTKITTRNGVVMVNGEARNAAEKDLVTKLTSDIHGVKSVMNNMEVKE